MVTSNLMPAPHEPGPAWDIARLFPPQGAWSEFEYLSLTEDTNWLVELTRGRVEVLAMPTMVHQLIVAYLYRVLMEHVESHKLGRALFAPLRVRLAPDVIREPDIVFMRAQNAARMKNDCWEGADLVVEVVSDDPESRHRDLVRKRTEYAEAAIAEYWIVDPQEARITVLALEGSEYAVHAEAGGQGKVASRMLKGLEVEVGAVMEAGEGK